MSLPQYTPAASPHRPASLFERGACNKMRHMQRLLIAIGLALLLTGLVWPWLARLGLGRLPGDIRIDTANGIFYLPITTCVIISVVLSLVLWFIRR